MPQENDGKASTAAYFQLYTQIVLRAAAREFRSVDWLDKRALQEPPDMDFYQE